MKIASLLATAAVALSSFTAMADDQCVGRPGYGAYECPGDAVSNGYVKGKGYGGYVGPESGEGQDEPKAKPEPDAQRCHMEGNRIECSPHVPSVAGPEELPPRPSPMIWSMFICGKADCWQPRGSLTWSTKAQCDQYRQMTYGRYHPEVQCLGKPTWGP